MTAQQPLRMDPDSFLAWEIRQERRYELVGGVVRLMAGASRAHLTIQANLLVSLSPRLKGHPCRAYQEQKITIPSKNYRYADVAVDCGALGMRDLMATGPRVAFEVESPSTGFLEEMDRLADYQSVPTMEHIVVLSQDRAFARVWTRTPDGWSTADAVGREAALALPGLDLAIAMAEIYDGVTFEAATEA